MLTQLFSDKVKRITRNLIPGFNKTLGYVKQDLIRRTQLMIING